jgi:polygalacturonase
MSKTLNSLDIGRRGFLRSIGIPAAGAALFSSDLAAAAAEPILGRRLFDVTAYGATGKGEQLDHPAINQAIAACNGAGGGVVYLPPGLYRSGTVELKSNVTLYLEAGATLMGSPSLADYPDHIPATTRKIISSYNQKYTTGRHLIFARDAENIGLAGPGRIDGNGMHFSKSDWKVLGRISPMIEIVGCRHVLIEGVRIENNCGYSLRPINCDHVVIRGIAINSRAYGPNSDGMDPTGCQNLSISDCYIESEDDALCLKSENPYGDDLRLMRNVTITNCVLASNCNALKLGTPTGGGFENITFSNSVIFNGNKPADRRPISGIDILMVDGGWVEGVVISNIRMQNVQTPIFIRRGNRTPRPDGTPGTLRGVMIENVHATGTVRNSAVAGLPGIDVEDVTLSNIRIENLENGTADGVDRAIPELPEKYPEANMFGKMPAYGFYCRHVKGLRMRGVEFTAAPGEARPAIVCDDVRDLDIDGLRAAAVISGQPVVKLTQTKAAFLRGCCAPTGTKTFLEVQGEKTERIILTGNDLGTAEKPVRLGSDVPRGTVSVAKPVEIE